MLSNLRLVWIISIMHFKQMAVDGFVIFTIIIQPLLIAVLAIYLLRDAQDFQPIYIVVGSAMSGLWSGTIFISSRGVVAERSYGTLEEIVGSPTDISVVVVAKSVATGVLSITSMLLTYPLAAFLFGYKLTISAPFLFAVSIPLSIIAVVSLSMVFAPIMALNPGSWIWSNAIEFPVYLVSGFLFPILFLPSWSRPISYILAPYWAARVLHVTTSGQVVLQEIITCWTALIILSILNLSISKRLFKIMLIRARVEDTLGKN